MVFEAIGGLLGGIPVGWRDVLDVAVVAFLF